MTRLKVVALGGGHGLAASLAALRTAEVELTAIVTVADNGGSSGRLRRDLAILPPGDLRMALAALCADDQWGRRWASILQHRFGGQGPLAGHTVGNLLMAGIWDMTDDPVSGLDLVGQLLESQGRVLPMSTLSLQIEADVRLRELPDRISVVRGQSEVATVDGEVLNVRLDPTDPPACTEAVEAVRSADWVVVGPGSWFTSVMPNLLVPQLRAALMQTAARRLLVLNLQQQPGETAGLSPADHLDALARHAPELRLDAVIADTSFADDSGLLAAAASKLGARLEVSEVARSDAPDQHDPDLLGSAFARFLRPGIE